MTLVKKVLKWLGSIIFFIWLATKLFTLLSMLPGSISATELSDSTAGYALDLANSWALTAEAAKADRTGETLYYAGLSDQKYKKLRRLAENNEYKILNKATSICNDALKDLQSKTISDAANAYEICAQSYRDAAGDDTHVKEIPVTPIPLGIITAGYLLDMANDLTLAAEAAREGRDYGYLYYTGLTEEKSNMVKELANRSEYATIGITFQSCEDAWKNVSADAAASVRINALEKCINAYQNAAGDVAHVKKIPFTPVPLGPTTAGYFLDMADDYAKAAEAAEVGRTGAVMYLLAVLTEKAVILSDMTEPGEDILLWNAVRICADVMMDVPANAPHRVVDGLEICAQAYRDAAGDVTQIKAIPFTPVPLSATTAGYALDLANNWMLAAEAAKADRMSTAEYFSKLSDEKAIILPDMIESGEEILLWKAFQTCEDVMVDAPISSPLIIADIFEICAQAYRDAAGDVTHAKVIPFTPIPLSDSTARYVLDMADGLAKAAEAARSENRNELVYYMDSYEQQYGTLYNTTKPGEDVVVLKADLICEDAFNTLTDDSLLSDLADAIEDCVQAYYDVADMKQ